MADPRGRQGSKLFHFHAVFSKKMQKNRLAHPLWELAPPRENPGSASDICITSITSRKKGYHVLLSQCTKIKATLPCQNPMNP